MFSETFTTCALTEAGSIMSGLVFSVWFTLKCSCRLQGSKLAPVTLFTLQCQDRKQSKPVPPQKAESHINASFPADPSSAVTPGAAVWPGAVNQRDNNGMPGAEFSFSGTDEHRRDRNIQAGWRVLSGDSDEFFKQPWLYKPLESPSCRHGRRRSSFLSLSHTTHFIIVEKPSACSVNSLTH